MKTEYRYKNIVLDLNKFFNREPTDVFFDMIELSWNTILPFCIGIISIRYNTYYCLLIAIPLLFRLEFKELKEV